MNPASDAPGPAASRLARMRPALELRHRVLHSIRAFFAARGFVEVETPVRIKAPAQELHIDAEPSGDEFLRASPELQMKRLLAAGYPCIFQMGPCFRRGESGALHNPEFTMLEWYRAHADYADILADTKALVAHVAREALDTPEIVRGGRRVALMPEWERITVSEAFILHAGWDPCRRFDADRFDLDLVTKVEPNLPRDVPVVLTDYPVEAASLARVRRGPPPVAERWELYIAGVEIANAYSELTDAVEQRERFEECAALRAALGKAACPMDEAFLKELAAMPPSGGIALGVDRLVMLLAGADSLDEVMPFR